jgi:hypothetical protein
MSFWASVEDGFWGEGLTDVEGFCEATEEVLFL